MVESFVRIDQVAFMKLIYIQNASCSISSLRASLSLFVDVVTLLQTYSSSLSH